jgi:hypothetical protein
MRMLMNPYSGLEKEEKRIKGEGERERNKTESE